MQPSLLPPGAAKTPSGVFVPGHSATGLLRSLWSGAVARFPDSFPQIRIPETVEGFRTAYAQTVELAEANRQNSPLRVTIGSHLYDNMMEAFPFGIMGDTVPLKWIMSQKVPPLNVKVIEPYAGTKKGLKVAIPFQGRLYDERSELLELCEALYEDKIWTRQEADAIKWIVERFDYINLEERLVGAMGLLAELFSPEDLLRTGATVMAADFAGPAMRRLSELAPILGGRLLWVNDDVGANLLTQTPEIGATFGRISEQEDRPIDWLALAYAPKVEWQLMAAMFSIVEEYGAQAASLGMFLSTSMISEVPYARARQSLEAFERRHEQEKRKYEPHLLALGGRFYGKWIYPIQGTGYGGAQLSKIWAAERFLRDLERRRITISANTAPMTATRSLMGKGPFRNQLEMRAGLLGAERLGIYLSDVAFTRRVMLLSWIHDLLNTKGPGHASRRQPEDEARSAGEIFSKKTDGRVITYPYTLRSVSRDAAIGTLARGKGWSGPKGIPIYMKTSSAEIVRGGTSIIPPKPRLLEKVAKSLAGPLARAIAGGDGAKAVRSLFLGNIDPMPTLAKMAMGSVVPNLIGNLVGRLAEPDDLLTVTVDADGVLQSIGLGGPGGREWELRLGLPGTNRIEQVFYLDVPLPDGSPNLVIEHLYDSRKGELRGTDSRKVNRELLNGERIGLPDHWVVEETIKEFEDLTAQEAFGSLSFWVNNGVQGPALAEVLKPHFGIALSRLTVSSIEAVAEEGELLWDSGFLVQPTLSGTVLQASKGERLQASIRSSIKGQLVNTVNLGLYEFGNIPPGPFKPETQANKIKDRQLKDQGGSVRPITFMDQSSLHRFGLLNGDTNPLHRNRRVARLFGKKGPILHGVAIFAEIERDLRQLTGSNLPFLKLEIIGSVYPRQTLDLEVRDNEFQLIEQSKGQKRNLIAAGSFQSADRPSGVFSSQRPSS